MNRFMRSCWNCKDRKVGCHESCEKYAQEKAVVDDISRKRFEESRMSERHYNVGVAWHKKRGKR